MLLREFFAHKRDHIASDELNELNGVRKNLEQYCNQVQNIIFGQNVEIENRLTQTKIQNAINVHSVIYLVWLY